MLTKGPLDAGRAIVAAFLGVALDIIKCERSFLILQFSLQTERTTRGG